MCSNASSGKYHPYLFIVAACFLALALAADATDSLLASLSLQNRIHRLHANGGTGTGDPPGDGIHEELSRLFSLMRLFGGHLCFLCACVCRKAQGTELFCGDFYNCIGKMLHY
mgnify:CR=1 FL=1